jgi:hypothetical protein
MRSSISANPDPHRRRRVDGEMASPVILLKNGVLAALQIGLESRDTF